MTAAVIVECSVCGRTLKGAEGLKGYHVPRHKTPEKAQCWGSRRTDHRRLRSDDGATR